MTIVAARHTRVVARNIILISSLIGLSACASSTPSEAETVTPSPAQVAPTPVQEALLDSISTRTFRFFWEQGDPKTGMMHDRWPTPSFVSVASTGFALTAYPIGVEQGHVTRGAAAERVLTTLEFFWQAPQGPDAQGMTGHKGFMYHFLEPSTGHRFKDVELSTVDTALLLGGVLFCQSYFDGDAPAEQRIRALADSLYLRVEWDWAAVRPPAVSHGWNPESGHLEWDWIGYSEAMLVYVLALGSPSHPIDPSAWSRWTSGYRWGDLAGFEHVGFAPLFGHQYSHVWIDFRGIQDEYMRSKGIDYFENSRRATLAQRAYAIANPHVWKGYGERLWGLTACDGPVNLEKEVGGAMRQFETYSARGASFDYVHDDGTIAPTAMAASLPFAPEVVLPGLVAMHEDHPYAFSTYGFLDAFNPTFDFDVPVQHGEVLPGVGWVDHDYLGIDQGPILAMIENYRTDLVWRVMRTNPHIVRGLRTAGFSGGWLDSIEEVGTK